MAPTPGVHPDGEISKAPRHDLHHAAERRCAFNLFSGDASQEKRSCLNSPLCLGRLAEEISIDFVRSQLQGAPSPQRPWVSYMVSALSAADSQTRKCARRRGSGPWASYNLSASLTREIKAMLSRGSKKPIVVVSTAWRRLFHFLHAALCESGTYCAQEPSPQAPGLAAAMASWPQGCTCLVSSSSCVVE